MNEKCMFWVFGDAQRSQSLKSLKGVYMNST